MMYPSNRITIDTEQCGGRPCVRGMRIRVTDVAGSLLCRIDRKSDPRRDARFGGRRFEDMSPICIPANRSSSTGRVTIWIDAQLSPSLAQWITGTFGVPSRAVRDLGLR